MQSVSTKTCALRCVGVSARAAGFTLVELLIVMSLVALMLGIGLGVMSRFDLADRVALSEVQNVLRSAHNWAVAREAPARVVLDPTGTSLHAEAMEVVGTWHFELPPKKWSASADDKDRELLGAFGLGGSLYGGAFVDDGYQGQALSFEGEPRRSHADLHVQSQSSFDLSRGFTLRCAVRHAGARGGVLLDAGGAMGLETTDEGGLKAWISPQNTDEKGQTSRGGRIPLATGPGLLTPGRWSTVEVQYDGRRFTLIVDEQPAAEVMETAPVSKLDGPVAISPGETPFPGAIDNLVIAATIAHETTKLPKSVHFAKGSASEIRFAPGGGLDRTRHREPVKLAIEYDDGRTESILVNLFGTVE